MSEELNVSYDPETLREVYADPAAVQTEIARLREKVLAAPDVIDELVARAELVTLLRATGELDEALVEGRRARDRAEVEGNHAQQHTARLRLAQVHQWRGEFAEANLAFTELLAASTQFGPVIEAFTHQHAGLNDYDQGCWADARDHFLRAATIREELELEDGEPAESRVALAAALRHLEADESGVEPSGTNPSGSGQ
jgi:tetratricopeptide (TPR) repeat protein